MLKRAVFCKPKNYICENIYVCTHTKKKTSYPIIYELNRKTIMQLTSPPCNSSRCLIFSLPSFSPVVMVSVTLKSLLWVSNSLSRFQSTSAPICDCCTPPSSEARNNDAEEDTSSWLPKERSREERRRNIRE